MKTQSICQNCVYHKRHEGKPVEMLSTYALRGLQCDCCGRTSDLAITKEAWEHAFSQIRNAVINAEKEG